MDQLINSLPALLRAAGDVKEVALTAASSAWDHIAGEALRSHTMVIDLNDQRLIVAVEDKVWQRQLESMRGQLLFRLNSVLGTGTVKFIEYQVDSRAIEGRKAKTEKRAQPTNLEAIPLEVVTAAASIQNPALRRAFLGAAASSLQRRKSHRK